MNSQAYSYFISLLLALITVSPLQSSAQESLSLKGKWQVALDNATNVSSVNFTKSLTLPGTLDDAGIGLTPDKQTVRVDRKTGKPETMPVFRRLTRKHLYIGPTWYQRQVVIPQSMAGHELELRLERVMWQSHLFVDGKDMGQINESLTTPHLFRIPALKAGRHTITLRIDNNKQHDISVDELAHAYTNDTQIKWNGVLGDMTLSVAPVISEVQVYPNIHNKTITVKVNATSRTKFKGISFAVDGRNVNAKSTSDGYVIALPGIGQWSEFTPEIHTLSVSLGKEQHQTTFGMREVTNHNGQLQINGNRVFLRGTLECCAFPLTGTPPTTVNEWLTEMVKAKNWGINHLRFHSWCPPDEAFQAADQLGMYLQIELPQWSLTVNSDSATNKFLYSEYRNIVRNYGSHPSFIMMTCGNELQPDFKWLNSFVKYMKQTDPRHLYACSSFTFEKGHGGHPEPEDQFFITQWTDDGWVRGQGVFEDVAPSFNKDYVSTTKKITVPMVSHEIGQYSVYPDMSEIDKYKGVLDPLNFKTIRDDLKRKGLLSRSNDYLMASGKLAAILYKEEIERAMKTPNFTGFQLLGLSDFPGQGTALVGLLDAFWDSKGVVKDSWFRQFNAPIVPLAYFGKAVYSANETFNARLKVTNFTNSDLSDKTISWTLSTDNGDDIANGKLNAAMIKKGGLNEIGSITAKLSAVARAEKLTLKVSVDGTPYYNSWSIWVYPDVTITADDIVMTADLNTALKALKKGKKVLFSPKKEQVNGLEGKFLPVFWSPVHFPKQAGTMGLLPHAESPALSLFPTDNHSDWQWWRLAKNSRVMVIDSIPQVTPLVEDVDNFVNNRRLASIFEARVGKGKLIMSSMDLLSDNIKDSPEVRQLRYSLVEYMKSPDFNPSDKTSIISDDVQNLISKTKVEKKTGATSIYE